MLIIGAKELRASPFLPTLAATAPRMWKGLGWAVECWWELRAGSALKACLFGKSCEQGVSSEVESSPCLLPACSFFLKLSWMMNSPRGATVKPLVSGYFKISWCLASMKGRKKLPYDELNLSHFPPMFWCHLYNGFSRWSQYDVVTSILKVGARMLFLLKG